MVTLSVLLPASSFAGRGAIDVEQFRPAVDGRGLFSAESADTHAPLQFGVGLILHYSQSPLIAIAPTARDKVGDFVSNRLTGEITLSLGLLRWLELGAALPVALANDQNAGLQGESAVTGLASMRFQLKLRLLAEGLHGIGLSFLPVLILPTGNNHAFLGQNGVVFSPTLLFERHFGIARLLANLGYTFREEARFLNLSVDDQIFWRFGLGLRVHDYVELGAELFGGTPAASPFGSDVGGDPLELLFGARFLPTSHWQVQLGGGPGLSRGFGTPSFRLFAGLVFAPHELDTDGDGVPDRIDRCPTEPGSPKNQGCPWGDSDGDGVPDNQDDCPTVPGPRENRGCPWPDTDGDGVPDREDKCPTVPGPKENQGCPWPDTDGDGIPDKDDKCPTVPGPKENQGCPLDTDGDGVLDKDDKCPTVPGPKENQGCPWPDLDKDGVPDKDDRCPMTPGPKENQGCPWPDTDGDGILDKDDRCPTVKGPKENQGCPWPDTDGDGVPDKDDECPLQPGPASNKGCPLKAVVVTRDEVRIREQIFFRSGSATILPRSYYILNDVASALKSFPALEVEVQGHTDDVGGEKMNLRLSEKRAESVKRYLVRKGVGPHRLTHRGYGLTQPRQPIERGMSKKELKAARALNRRVQFIILKK
jgi:outer membrane protein OmpA-like peptidoglycan-associated protein